MHSINTNLGAMIALQNLNAITSNLQKTQNRISTGLRINSAKDDGALFAIAQSQRAEVKSFDSVKESLARGSSSIDVALAAGDSVADLLSQLKEKALAASDTSLDTTSRNAIRSDFVSLRNQITKTLSNASFNGINLLNGSRASIAALANASGTSHITVSAQDMSLGGSIITLGATADFASAASAESLLSTLDSSIRNVSSALSKLGTSAKALDTHSSFISKLQDTMEEGIGKLIDADMARESLTLQSLQVRQQLAIQTLSISNQSSSAILSLFR